MILFAFDFDFDVGFFFVIVWTLCRTTTRVLISPTLRLCLPRMKVQLCFWFVLVYLCFHNPEMSRLCNLAFDCAGIFILCCVPWCFAPLRSPNHIILLPVSLSLYYSFSVSLFLIWVCVSVCLFPYEVYFPNLISYLFGFCLCFIKVHKSCLEFKCEGALKLWCKVTFMPSRSIS